jgi:signal transduction histidine kinase
MQSLRKRAWISGGLSALVAVALGTMLLYSYLDQQALDRFDRTLIDRHTQLVVALSNVADDPDRLGELIFDPAFSQPASGRYWQVVGPDGAIYTSGSLLEATLPLTTPGATLSVGDAVSADGERLRTAEQQIRLEDGRVWTVAAAESLAGLNADRAETRRSLVLAFALVAAMGLAATLFQTAVIVQPLDRLRKDVTRRWERDETLNASDYPEEVAPLVDDINTLLQRNRDIVARSRRQAADLAHALKTPSAILRNELSQLQGDGHDTQRANDALDRLDAQLSRSLARIRMSNTGEAGFTRTDLSATVTRFARAFGKLAERDDKRIDLTCDPGLHVRIDPQDLEEMLGNLVDNGLKWCRTRVHLSARRVPEGIALVVEDDGPGIPVADREAALLSGRRLDTSKPGTGLGLSIVSDLVGVYGGRLDLEEGKSLSGLLVRVTLPAVPE